MDRGSSYPGHTHSRYFIYAQAPRNLGSQVQLSAMCHHSWVLGTFVRLVSTVNPVGEARTSLRFEDRGYHEFGAEVAPVRRPTRQYRNEGCFSNGSTIHRHALSRRAQADATIVRNL